MKYVCWLLAAGCSLSAVHAQWLETTIYLPFDVRGSGILYVADVGKAYLGDDGNQAVLVIDGARNTVSGRVQLPLQSGPGAFCYNPVNQKLYCIEGSARGVVAVVDVNRDSVVAVVESTSAARSLCWNPAHNKVYCLERGGDSGHVLVIDGASDTVEGRIELPTCAYALCYNSTNDKLYCAHDWDSTVTVIDCGTNQVLRTVGAVTHPEVFAYNPHQNRVYVSTYCCNALAILDGSSDVRLARMSLIDPWCMLFDTLHDELFVSSGSSTIMTVIGGSSNQIEHQTEVGSRAGRMCLDERAGRLYCTQYYDDSLAIIDCSTHTVARRFHVGGGPGAMAWNPGFSRTYVVCNDSHCIRVFRDSAAAVNEDLKQQTSNRKPAATILSGASGIKRLASGVIFDAMGRRVLNPKSGVYFVREAQAQAQAQAIRKVVITR